jgi:hypothetical protein
MCRLGRGSISGEGEFTLGVSYINFSLWKGGLFLSQKIYYQRLSERSGFHDPFCENGKMRQN